MLGWGKWKGHDFPYEFVNGRKEIFYLTTHSTHFIYGLYGVRHMVKDHLDSETGNPLPPHRLFYPNDYFTYLLEQGGNHI